MICQVDGRTGLYVGSSVIVVWKINVWYYKQLSVLIVNMQFSCSFVGCVVVLGVCFCIGAVGRYESSVCYAKGCRCRLWCLSVWRSCMTRTLLLRLFILSVF